MGEVVSLYQRRRLRVRRDAFCERCLRLGYSPWHLLKRLTPESIAELPLSTLTSCWDCMTDVERTQLVNHATEKRQMPQHSADSLEVSQ